MITISDKSFGCREKLLADCGGSGSQPYFLLCLIDGDGISIHVQYAPASSVFNRNITFHIQTAPPNSEQSHCWFTAALMLSLWHHIGLT